jgi:hypothetical protein
LACPYFYPTKRLESSAWAIPPRLPLGDPYAGECRAGVTPSHPDEERMRAICNTGYGRGRCACFPSDATVDAVRFHIADDGRDLIRIQYVFEKLCWPQRHGAVEYSVVSRTFAPAPGDDLLEKQAVAFVESYLRRRAS